MNIEAARGKASESLTLFVAWKAQRTAGAAADGSSTPYVAAKIDRTDEVTSHLRNACLTALGTASDATRVDFTADAELLDNQVFLIDQAEVLTELDHLRQVVEGASGLDAVPPAQLSELHIEFYGVAAGNDLPRLGFVKKANPVKVARRGQLFTTGRARLAAIEDPLIALDSTFDFVLGDDWAAVLDQRHYELLVRSSPTMQAHIAAWVDGISLALPLSTASETALREAATRDSRLWGRLRAINQRGHLAAVDMKKLRTYAKAMGLDPDKIIVDGQLEFAADDRFTMVKLLNEDLYSGGLTGERFEAQRKGALRL